MTEESARARNIAVHTPELKASCQCQPTIHYALAVDTAVYSVPCSGGFLAAPRTGLKVKGQPIYLSFCIHVSYNYLTLVPLTFNESTAVPRDTTEFCSLRGCTYVLGGWGANNQIHIESRRADATVPARVCCQTAGSSTLGRFLDLLHVRDKNLSHALGYAQQYARRLYRTLHALVFTNSISLDSGVLLD